MEKNIKIAYMLIVIAISMIFIGLIMCFVEASNEAYCNSLDFREYCENKECRRFMK